MVRTLWNLLYSVLFRPTPVFLHSWRRWLLKLFGAKIGRHVHVYPSAQIWAPWNLEMAEYSCLAPFVNCYCVDKITIGRNTTISQYTFLCSASHDYEDASILDHPYLPLVTAPIIVGNYVWVTADVFIAPGVTVGEGAVILARSTVVQDVPPWVVVGGTPAVVKKKRQLKTKLDTSTTTEQSLS